MLKSIRVLARRNNNFSKANIPTIRNFQMGAKNLEKLDNLARVQQFDSNTEVPAEIT